MFVKDIMTKNVKTIDCKATVLEVCRRYKDEGISSLVVTDKDMIVGIITERDIIEKIILDNKDPLKTIVIDIMSPDIHTVHASATVEEAADVMGKNRIKKLPVVLNNKIVGVVTVTDISNAMPKLTKQIILDFLEVV